MKAKSIINAVQGVTKKWAKQRKAEERNKSAELNREYAMTRRRHVSLREAAWEVMETAYLQASGNGSLPAHARQIMYKARPLIQELADRMQGKGFDKYFTQTLLPDYIEENGCEDWNVVWDARGRLIEPHTGKQVPLGTIQVGNYLCAIENHEVGDLDFDITEARYPTYGPENAYSAILFIEKEGFFPLFDQVRLAQRYDIAIMSTKGMSVTAARHLIDCLGTSHDIPTLVLHDFDKSGFSIVGTLQRDTRRYTFKGAAEIIDLGLRLADVNAEGLPSEYVSYGRDHKSKIRDNLELNGATPEEIEFLMRRRVELNAFASDQLVAWIERKLKQQGVKKVVPDKETLTEAYHRMQRQLVVKRKIDEALEELGDEKRGRVPPGLAARVAKATQKKGNDARWDDALRAIVEAEDEKKTGAKLGG